jgi:hypothetical protein
MSAVATPYLRKMWTLREAVLALETAEDIQRVLFIFLSLIIKQRADVFFYITALCSHEAYSESSLPPFVRNIKLIKKFRLLLPSDSAPILQYVSGSSPNFLAKILNADTQVFLCKTQFHMNMCFDGWF